MGCVIFLLSLATPGTDLTTRIFLHDLSDFLLLYLSKITQEKINGYLSLFSQLAFPLVG